MKLLKKILFCLSCAIILTFVVATVLEKTIGTDFVSTHIYGSALFVMLWVTIVVFAAIYFLKRNILKRPAVMALHASFLIILAGAFITWMYGEQGMLHLRKGNSVSAFTDSNGLSKNMPFSMKLNDFQIIYYIGTRAPMDFISIITVSENNHTTTGEVAMNRVFSHNGYRFYQSGYDEDAEGVMLSVAHDPYGITVTYIGYALLLLSAVIFFFDPKSEFRRLLKCGTLICLALVCAANMQAADASHKLTPDNPRVLPGEIAAQFGNLYVLYNNRICPLQTLAKDFTTKLYGRASYRGLTPEQVFTGWMFYYTSWKAQPMIKIKSKKARQILEISNGCASLDDFYDKYNAYKLEDVMEQIHFGEAVQDERGLEAADEKFNIIATLYSGQLLKIYPHSSADHVEWYSQSDDLPDDLLDEEWFFIKKSFDYIHEMVIMKNYDDLAVTLAKLKEYQQKKAGDVLPSASKLNAEKIYNRLQYTRQLAMFCMLAGMLSFIYYCRLLIRNQKVRKPVVIALNMIGICVFLYLTVTISLRWYVSNHVPLANGFETMQFMAWFALVPLLLIHKKFPMSAPFGLLLCGLTLLVAMLGESNPRITQLAPVLSSPLLSIHVMIIMVSYALFAFMMFNGLMAIALFMMKKDHSKQIARLSTVSRIMLYPAVFCLAAGIFIGAIWANQTWGRYWGWDPKEVWALVTMLVYSFALHTQSVTWFRRPMFFHLFAVVAFLCVLITYFGVNFILGGLHSYA